MKFPDLPPSLSAQVMAWGCFVPHPQLIQLIRTVPLLPAERCPGTGGRPVPPLRSPLSLLPCTWRHLRGVNTHGMRTWRDGRGTSGQKRKSNEDFNLHWSKKRWCCAHAGGLSQVSPLPCLSGWGGLGAFLGIQGERTGHGGLIYFLLIFIGLLAQELITKTNESLC